MYSSAFQALKAEYETARGIAFSEEQFAALVYTFPSILVANADGNVDSAEKHFLRSIPRQLVSAYVNEGEGETAQELDFNDNYFAELNWIIKGIKRWEGPMMSALKEELQNEQNDKNAIYEMMWRTADSSADISEQEVASIRKITERLGL